MRVLFFFMDGVGLGESGAHNPFARAEMPFLHSMLRGRRLVRETFNPTAKVEGELCTLLALDTQMGVGGMPQSATGQTTLLTGKNIPEVLGMHFGPKPNREIAALIQEGTIFLWLKNAGLSPAFLNAYPPRYFHAIESGRRSHAAIPLAVEAARIPIRTYADLVDGSALSADLTGRGWREHLGFDDIPLLIPQEAGIRLAELSQAQEFAFFEFWLSDYIGHKQDMPQALEVLSMLDKVFEGLFSAWDLSSDLVLVTSDHGNLEDLSTRRHTQNPAPALLIGNPEVREQFARQLHSLQDVTPTLIHALTGEQSQV